MLKKETIKETKNTKGLTNIVKAKREEKQSKTHKTTPEDKFEPVEPVNDEIKPIHKLINEVLQTVKESPACLETVALDGEKEKDLKLLETLEFHDEKNKLSIRFSQRHNRMFRMQVFLNDEIEIRPCTYNGSSTAYSYWKLLKGALKK